MRTWIKPLAPGATVRGLCNPESRRERFHRFKRAASGKLMYCSGGAAQRHRWPRGVCDPAMCGPRLADNRIARMFFNLLTGRWWIDSGRSGRWPLACWSTPSRCWRPALAFSHPRTPGGFSAAGRCGLFAYSDRRAARSDGGFFSRQPAPAPGPRTKRNLPKASALRCCWEPVIADLVSPNAAFLITSGITLGTGVTARRSATISAAVPGLRWACSWERWSAMGPSYLTLAVAMRLVTLPLYGLVPRERAAAALKARGPLFRNNVTQFRF